jgi:hypothetical protein
MSCPCNPTRFDHSKSICRIASYESSSPEKQTSTGPVLLHRRTNRMSGGSNCDLLRSHVKGSNDATLGEVGLTTAVPSGGASWTRKCVVAWLWDTSSWSRWATTASVLGLTRLTGAGG